MAKLFDLDFAGGSLPTGVSATGAGATVQSGGLIGGASFRGKVAQPGSTPTYFNADFNTMSGVGRALIRGVGGYFKSSARTTASGVSTRLLRLQGNSNANFLCQFAFNGSTSDPTGMNLIFADNGGNWNLRVADVTADSLVHKFFMGYACSASANQGSFVFYLDGRLIVKATLNNTTVTYGTGVSNCYLGDHVGAAGMSQTVEYGGIYVTDSLTPSTSSTGDGVVTGYSSPVAAATPTLQLSTPTGSPVWRSDDSSVLSVNSSTGLVTCAQAAGGSAWIDDGFGGGCIVEFARRTPTWLLGIASRTGSGVGAVWTVPLTLTAVSDGNTSYSDLYPGMVGNNCSLTGITGTMPNLTATFVQTSASTPGVYFESGLQNFFLAGLLLARRRRIMS